MNDKELYGIAVQAMACAYAPYSNFRVGAALLTEDGRVFTGVNVENATYGATICAERTAIVKAVSEGASGFVKIAVASSGGKAMPCGICRQVLAEFARDIEVLTGDDAEHVEQYRLAELLPYSFELER